jgi:hypothetical protein
MAVASYRTNGDLIAAAARLGYLRKDWITLDPTFGLGVFWSVWRPDILIAHDLDPTKSPTGESVDATDLPYPDRSFPAGVIDGPYKLNGTPDLHVDGRFGVDKVTRWQDRMALLARMLEEGARVGDGFLLFKCQDQVCSGRVRWQADIFTEQARRLGLGKVDRLDFASYRPQPDGVRQVTARRNTSSLLVFRRGWTS